jgi:T-complex protein 1 subunit theta
MKQVKNVRDQKELAFAIQSVLASKQYGFEDTLAPFVAEACLTVLPANVVGSDFERRML